MDDRPQDPRAYMGYGVYAFGQTTPDVGDIIENLPQYIVVEGSLRILRPDVRKTVIDGLNSLKLNVAAPPGGPMPPLLQGTVELAPLEALLGGDDWATEYRDLGYAILGNPDSITMSGGQVALTNDAATLAQLSGLQGQFVIIDAPAQLLAAAKTIATGEAPPPQPPTPLPPTPPAEQPPAAKAEAGLPDWALPAAIGLGVLALAVAVSRN